MVLQLERESGNMVKRTRTYDEARRPLTHEHRKSDNTLITGFNYKWDKMDNRRYEERMPGLVTGSPGDTSGQADYSSGSSWMNIEVDNKTTLKGAFDVRIPLKRDNKETGFRRFEGSFELLLN